MVSQQPKLGRATHTPPPPQKKKYRHRHRHRHTLLRIHIYMYLVTLYMILPYLWSCDVYNNNPMEYNKSQFLPFNKNTEKKKEVVLIR